MSFPTTTSGKPPAGARTGTAVNPLGELAFKVEIQDVTLGRFAECTGLAAEYDVTEYAEGGNNEFVHQLRGRIRYPHVTLARGVTYEDQLLRWFYATHKVEKRPPVTITFYDSLGKSVRHFALSAALPVRWSGPSAATGSDRAAMESLEIAHQGFA